MGETLTYFWGHNAEQIELSGGESAQCLIKAKVRNVGIIFELFKFVICFYYMTIIFVLMVLLVIF